MDPTKDGSPILALIYVVPPMIGVGFLLMLLGLRFGVDSLVLPLAGIAAGTALRVVVVLVRKSQVAQAKRRHELVARPPLSRHHRVATTWSVKGLREFGSVVTRTVTATHQRARQGYQKLMTLMPEASFMQKLQDFVRTYLRTSAEHGGRDEAHTLGAAEGSGELGTTHQQGSTRPNENPNQPHRRSSAERRRGGKGGT